MTWPTPPQNPNNGNFDALLGGGRSIPTASFKGQFPVAWDGIVEDVTKKPAYEYDPSKPNNRGAQKFWPDGNPVENLWITLQTQVRDPQVQDDDGRRVLVLDSKNKLAAVQDAVRESGASFAKGGRLLIEWYGNDPNGKNPDNPPKLYRARYQGPTFDAALGGAGQQQPAPPTPPAQGGWGQQAAAPAPASPAPGTGGWGNPAPAPQAGGWGAPQQQAPAPTAPAPQVGGWGAPPAPAAPAGVHPDLVEALRRKGVTLQPNHTQQDAESIWGYVANNPDVA